jgi:hypothetical protein
VRERPIIFSGPMVRALMLPTMPKTQTRRVIKADVDGYEGVIFGTTPAEIDRIGKHCFMDGLGESVYIACPYGAQGDRLWVRETFAAPWGLDYKTPGGERGIFYRADHPEPLEGDGRWTPAIHMPRAACRILLDVVRVRVERLWDISADDAFAEGIEAMRCPDCHLMAFGLAGWRHGDMQPTPIEAYWHLWDKINEARGYGRSKNPWTWVVEFKRGET